MRKDYPEEFYTDLLDAQAIYIEILDILVWFFAGKVIIWDELLNRLYLTYWIEFEEIVNKYPEEFKEIISLDRPIESLSPGSFDNPDKPQREWDYRVKKTAYKINDLLYAMGIKYLKKAPLHIAKKLNQLLKDDVKPSVINEEIKKDFIRWKIKEDKLYVAELKEEENILNKAMNIPNKTTKSMRKQGFKSFMKTCKLGVKEHLLLKHLSDFEPKEIKAIAKEVKTKDITHLKASVQKKLKGSEYGIKTIRGNGSKSFFYQLVFLIEK